ncbi:Putative signal transducing protein [Desulfacinum infernum DSM 9756]|uniref:Putative signal transducing protein n=1 Tax=Desulfacinum infernum DSM 9756 TaxID=1121391 RepID=A0A1M4UHD0_9BACT|nr:DUF3786 domain-containing protein [Desulfacinum infernum]SHE56109.1 Putative signal transducing protein [Desulfacinum infernum DSM 9756]
MTKEDAPRWMLCHTLANRFEADLLTDALEKEGIPILVRSFEETAYDGLFVPQRGWGQILVPAQDITRARAVIAPLLETLEAQGPYQNLEELDPLLWERLRKLDTEEVCRRAQVQWLEDLRAYRIPFLNGAYACRPEEEAVDVLEPLPSSRVDFQTGLFLLHYLLEARPVPLEGRWISEKEIPGGLQFFAGPHAFPLPWVLKSLDHDLNRFCEAAERLGGVPVEAGDAAYRFWVLPRIPVQAVFWEGDDEFKASLHLRFDPSISRQLEALDTIWALVNVFCRHFRDAASQPADLSSASP